MATWRCYSSHGLSYVESPDNPSNESMQCVLESGDPGDVPDDTFRPPTRVRLPPIAPVVLGFGPQQSLGVASVPVFRDPVGPTPEDPYTDPTMAEIINPPSSPTTNLLQGPWNGKLQLSANTGIDPKFSFANSDDEKEANGENWFSRNQSWLWILLVGACLYAWSKSK